MIRLLLAAAICAATLLAGCASPGERLQRTAIAAGLQHVSVEGGEFALSAYGRPTNSTESLLHIYLDSDGTPWERGYWPARDPSPRQSLALSLMSLDAAASIYLNRPCYGLAKLPPECHFTLWTDGRYSHTVVEAMNQGLDELRRRHGAQRLVLIGHSGGGALAMLLAARRQDVAAVVTIGANLDHRRWTEHFGYLPLTSSLNPAEEPPLPSGALRWHLIGDRDAVVPPAITLAAGKADPHARVVRFAQHDHRCCWERSWPDLLDELRKALSSPEG